MSLVDEGAPAKDSISLALNRYLAFGFLVATATRRLPSSCRLSSVQSACRRLSVVVCVCGLSSPVVSCVRRLGVVLGGASWWRPFGAGPCVCLFGVTGRPSFPL